jgi:hypothetical protein
VGEVGLLGELRSVPASNGDSGKPNVLGYVRAVVPRPRAGVRPVPSSRARDRHVTTLRDASARPSRREPLGACADRSRRRAPGRLTLRRRARASVLRRRPAMLGWKSAGVPHRRVVADVRRMGARPAS